MLASSVRVWTPHRKATAQSFHYKSLVTYLEFLSSAGLEISKTALSNVSSDGFISNGVMTEIIENQAVQIISRKLALIFYKFDL